MKATWSFDPEYECLYQDDEHGEDETEDVLQGIGSKAVAGSRTELELPAARECRWFSISSITAA